MEILPVPPHPATTTGWVYTHSSGRAVTLYECTMRDDTAKNKGHRLCVNPIFTVHFPAPFEMTDKNAAPAPQTHRYLTREYQAKFLVKQGGPRKLVGTQLGMVRELVPVQDVWEHDKFVEYFTAYHHAVDGRIKVKGPMDPYYF